MITRIVIPQIFENMEEATIGVWLKQEGDAVAPGDLLCELITEKTTFQLEAEGAGVLRQIAAPKKSIVPVGAIIGLLGDVGEELPDIEAENQALLAGKEASAPVAGGGLNVPSLSIPNLEAPAITAGAPVAGGAGGRLRATPAARRVARELNVVLEDVAVRFPGKVIGEDDVRAFAAN
jgi:pyruvate dehydrogenase E2 component (dihydrolipoamide acetyltransferase)